MQNFALRYESRTSPLPGLATHVHLDLAPDVRSPAFPFDAVYNETRAGARRLAALLAV